MVGGRIMNLKKQNLLITVLFAAFLCLCVPGIAFGETDENHDTYTFILKNNNQLNNVVRTINNLYPELQVETISEVGIVSIQLDNEEDRDQIILTISNKIRNSVDEMGEMPEAALPAEPIDPISIDAIPNSSINLEPSNKSAIQKNEIQFHELDSSYFSPLNWYLEDVTNHFQTKDIQKGDKSRIALIDSGIDVHHPLLSHNIDLKNAKNYIDVEKGVQDDSGHGTQVAGILTTLAPESLITPYKVIDETGGDSIWVIQAIIDAAKDGNDVINLSIGTYLSKSVDEEKVLVKAYDRAIKYAKKEGALVVASAGNSSLNLDDLKDSREFHLPGGSQHVITVSSNTKQNTLATYSNFGKQIDFSAPGGDLGPNFDLADMIITTYPINQPNTMLDQMIGLPQGYTLSMGTSLATPQVSAGASLIISEYRTRYRKDLNMNKVKKYLKDGSTPLTNKKKDIYFGHGKINIYQSLQKMKK